MKLVLASALIIFAFTETCVLDPGYQAQIDKDFMLFEDGITPEIINNLREADVIYKCYTKFVKGKSISTCDDDVNFRPYRKILKQFAPQFPDMQFVITLFDHPALYKNMCNSTAQHLRRCECAQDYDDSFPQHSYFRRAHVNKLFDKIPVFSQCVIPGCTNDILVPSYLHLQQEQSDERSLTAWQKKQFKAFWRGTLTDFWEVPAYITDPAEFSHRVHMIRLTKDLPSCDIRFTDYRNMHWTWMTKCFKSSYPLADLKLQELFGLSTLHKYKILIDIDGATYSARFPNLLQMGSAVFKANAFDDIGSIVTNPWEHYVPLNMNMSDFIQKLDWAKRNDRQLKQIAERGYQRSKEVHNYPMYKCYLWHVLKKYQYLLKKGGAI